MDLILNDATVGNMGTSRKFNWVELCPFSYQMMQDGLHIIHFKGRSPFGAETKDMKQQHVTVDCKIKGKNGRKTSDSQLPEII